MRKPSSEGAWARWGLLVSAVLLGMALIVASWSNYRSARAAESALHDGQARVFEREIFSSLRRIDDDPPGTVQAAVDTLLASHADEGLRYIALLGEDGAVTASAGSPAGPIVLTPPSVPAEPWMQLTRIGSRVRMSLFRPRNEPPPPRPEAEGHHHMRRPGGIVFEFEPLIAARLTEQAQRLLVFGLAAALVMLGVAVVSWGMARRYESAKRRLEQERRLSLLGEMSAVLAHEIRNPLASLKGNAQLLAERLADGSPERRKADLVISEAARLEALTADLLDFVRIGPVERESADPAALLRASADEVDAAGIEVDVSGAPATWPLDATRMRQVFVNLLRNARQAARPEAARPTVTMRSEDGRLVVIVRDRGAGLPKGQEDRIFDPFFTTRTTGTGLGLAVARRIVELHGGTIGARNHPEGGAIFTVSLPEGRS